MPLFVCFPRAKLQPWRGGGRQQGQWIKGEKKKQTGVILASQENILRTVCIRESDQAQCRQQVVELLLKLMLKLMTP